MRLADFITTHVDLIIGEWVEFAATCGPAAETMDLVALRDHAVQMLVAIAADLRTPQTGAEQMEKARGHAAPDPDDSDGSDTAAQVHGAGRAESGFTLGEMVSEYRALRASVIRLWTAQNGTLTGADIEDLTRFNEAIDQSLAESVTRYTQDLDQSKELFIAILGHDLRTPLAAVIMSSQFMLDTGELPEPHRTLAARVVRTGHRMNQMVGDLLDFTRIRLGSGVPLVRRPVDLAALVGHAVDETAAAHPECTLEFGAEGDVRGDWDGARVSQVLANLLGNAVQHGAATAPVRVTLRGEPASVVLRVHNRGPAIPPAALPGLFSPLKQLMARAPAARDARHLGLGLYIAERVVAAHGGHIDVTSSDADGTAFTVRLPR